MFFLQAPELNPLPDSAKLVEGKNAEEVASLLVGNTCGYKDTSCADQLAKAIRKAMN